MKKNMARTYAPVALVGILLFLVVGSLFVLAFQSKQKARRELAPPRQFTPAFPSPTLPIQSQSPPQRMPPQSTPYGNQRNNPVPANPPSTNNSAVIIYLNTLSETERERHRLIQGHISVMRQVQEEARQRDPDESPQDTAQRKRDFLILQQQMAADFQNFQSRVQSTQPPPECNSLHSAYMNVAIAQTQGTERTLQAYQMALQGNRAPLDELGNQREAIKAQMTAIVHQADEQLTLLCNRLALQKTFVIGD